MLILIIITILIDYLLSYFIPMYFNNINFLYPMLTITLIVFLYKKVEIKKYFKIIFFMGLLYDILFSYIFLFNSLIFLLIAKIIKKIEKYIRINFLVNIFLIIFSIFLYDLILFILVKITNYNNINLFDLLYKFKNSLVLNISYFFLLSIYFKNKISCNK